MVRYHAARMAVVHARLPDVEAAHVNAVELEYGSLAGKLRAGGRGVFEHLLEPQRLRQLRCAWRRQSLKSPAMISGASAGTSRSMRSRNARI